VQNDGELVSPINILVEDKSHWNSTGTAIRFSTSETDRSCGINESPGEEEWSVVRAAKRSCRFKVIRVFGYLGAV
jgi:hypothetical protein